MRRAHLLGACIGLALACTGTATAHAATVRPWWRLDATPAPSALRAGGELSQIVVTANNLGDVPVENSAAHKATLTDVLPANVTAVALLGTEGDVEEAGCSKFEPHTELHVVSCPAADHQLLPYEQMLMRIEVKTNGTPKPEETNEVTVAGGTIPSTAEEVPAVTLQKQLKIDTTGTASEVPFGVELYELTPENENGTTDREAGSHPFQLTTTFDLNQTLVTYHATGETGEFPSAPALPRDLRFELPRGFIGYPEAVPRCSEADFATVITEINLCPGDAAVGVATVFANIPGPYKLSIFSVPVFNLEPAPGEPARFGFYLKEVPVLLRTALPAGGDKGAEVKVEYASEAAQVLATQVTLWGVPDDPRHDGARGWECLRGGAVEKYLNHPIPCKPEDEKPPKASLTLPSDCSDGLESTVSGNSWAMGETEFPKLAEAVLPELTKSTCESLAFKPTIEAEPETHAASTPTGFNFDVKMPQEGLIAGEGRAEPPLKETTVALPAGLQLNPKAANGLEACSALDFGWPFTGAGETGQLENEGISPGPADCPDAAKVGTVTASTPLLAHELKGSVYLAAQNTNPFGNPLALYLVVEDPITGVRVKLAGEVHIEENGPSAGQVTTTFRNIPQVGLFRELKLHLFGGERASVSTPDFCGNYPVDTTFTPWSGEPAAQPPAGFAVTSGPGGGACPSAPLPFAPSHSMGPANPAAGAYSSFDVDLERPDGQQALSGISVKLPPGYAAVLKDVTPCAEPPAKQDEWTCNGGNEIGTVKVASGLGPNEPVELTGQAYLTTGYDGAPFGLLVRTLAKVGPFNLGYVNVRSRINVDPHTAAVTVTSDPGPREEGVPTRLRGVPVQLKRLEVAVNRPNFEFNPTNCNTMNFETSLDGSEGTVDSFNTPFAVTECAKLPFEPELTAYSSAKSSKADGESLTVKVKGKGVGQANIGKTVLILPSTLPARLTTIQKACVAATFEHNPASCPEGSEIGKGIARSPVLKGPLEGPAYLVSHGGAAWPDVEFVLKGEYGIELVLDGQTAIKKGVTTSTFNSVPDDPIETFEAILPEGPHSALTTNLPAKDKYSPCGVSIALPTTITGQNGKVIEQKTKLQVQGCPKGIVQGFQETLLKQFKKAMAKCHTKYKHAKARRAKCERTARAHYSSLAIAECRKTEKHSKKKLASCEATMRKQYGVKKPAHKGKKG